MMPVLSLEEILKLSMPDVGLLPAIQIPFVWPRVREIIREKGQEWLKVVDEKDVYKLLIEGQADLWGCTQNGYIEGVIVCMMERHSKASYYHVVWVGGVGLRKYLRKAVERLEKFACMAGCAELILEGRLGWERVLRPLGYHYSTVKMRKSVTKLWSH